MKLAKILKQILNEGVDSKKITPITKKHQKIIPEFEDQEEGFEVNSNLLLLEKHDNDLFYELTNLIRGKAKPIIRKLKKKEADGKANKKIG